jgi:Xaa-Pro aminopeptidase
MRRAAEITAAAHVRAMRWARPGLREADLEAEIVHEFMRSGARSPAYPSIVGAGTNACVLHYTRNDSVMRDGDLVLVDAGCEYQYYAADLTRTFPVNGRYTPPQRDLYEVVLEAQLAAIGAAVPGAPFDAIHGTAVSRMIDGLVSLGVLEGSRDEILATGAHLRYCAHKSSHWLGLDVHDVGDYRVGDAWRILEPGMVLTVEPGIYLPNDDTVPRGLRGLGIRIEDDVLVTDVGREVMTSSIPKSVEDVEAALGA